VVRIGTDGTVNRVVTGAVLRTALAQLDGAGELFDATSFDCNVLPTIVERSLDLIRNVDNLRGGNNLVEATDETIKDLTEPEAVFAFAILIKVGDFSTMRHLTLAAKGSDRANIGMHSSVNDSCVVVIALHVPRSIEPVDSHGLYWRRLVARLDMQKLHDSA